VPSPSPLITIGLGPVARIVSTGFGPTIAAVVEEVVRTARGSKRRAKKLYGIIQENLKISAMLISANGKELINPIINTVSKTFINDDILVKVIPRKLIARKSTDIKVEIKELKVRKENEQN